VLSHKTNPGLLFYKGMSQALKIPIEVLLEVGGEIPPRIPKEEDPVLREIINNYTALTPFFRALFAALMFQIVLYQDEFTESIKNLNVNLEEVGEIVFNYIRGEIEFDISEKRSHLSILMAIFPYKDIVNDRNRIRKRIKNFLLNDTSSIYDDPPDELPIGFEDPNNE
jgi:hypothetical protein